MRTIPFDRSRRLAIDGPRPRAPIACVSVLALLTIASPVVAETTTSSGDASQNPLEPLLKKLSDDWGVDVDAKRIALNPLKGTVVIRELNVESKLQGRFLEIPRMDVKVDWDEGQVVQAALAGAELQVELTKRLGFKQFQSEVVLGQVKTARLSAAKIAIVAHGRDLLKLSDLDGSASQLLLTSKGGELGVKGRVSISDGVVHLLDGNTAMTDLAVKGSFKGRSIEVSALSGKIGGGTVTCSGAIALDQPTKGRPGTLECHLERVRLKRGDFLDVVVSGDVKLVRRSKIYRLIGTVDVLSGSRLRSERWGGKSGGERDLFESDVTIRLKSKHGNAAARLTSSSHGGRIAVIGRNKRKTAQRVEEILKALSADSREEASRDE